MPTMGPRRRGHQVKFSPEVYTNAYLQGPNVRGVSRQGQWKTWPLSTALPVPSSSRDLRVPPALLGGNRRRQNRQYTDLEPAALLVARHLRSMPGHRDRITACQRLCEDRIPNFRNLLRPLIFKRFLDMFAEFYVDAPWVSLREDAASMFRGMPT